MFLRIFFALFWCLLFSVSTHAADIVGVGLKRLQFLDPVTKKPMSAAAFFPSSDSSQTTTIGPYEVAASRNAVISEGRYPIIMMSHGNRGSMWGHHDLATTLAHHGYIVVAVMHPGDNFEDFSRAGTASVLYGRPKQISASVDAALDDPELAPHVDATKIGFAGFSAGGTTGIILSGAKPTPSRLENYCATRPDDHSVCEARGKIQLDQPELEPSADKRIRAFVLLSPLSIVFSPEEIKRIDLPMLVAVGDKDEELSPEANAISLVGDLQNAQLKLIPNAGHFTFLAPCTQQLSATAPALCVDREGFDRVAFHRELNSEILDYFNRKLEVSP
ncbi:alpha/beta hydrolase family protein [Agrobacterium rosae]